MKVRQISNFVPQQDEHSSVTVIHDAIVAEGEEYIVDSSETIRSKNIITGWKIVTFGLLFFNVFFGVAIVGMLFAAISRSMPTFITKN